ncbi:MAG: zf-HC2 domain-containing protein [Oscillospiraceae bacterium]|jgi:predicted anti-sigma-YlaC factor YlaD|nr:zf-HC2 domain-containing protein [Oscillospiraceae bacterium]
MKHTCELVKDLLPLYHDEVCSSASRQMVEEHLAECPACKSVMEKLNDDTYSNQLQEEKNVVIEHYAKDAKRKKSTIAAICIGASLAIPVIVSLIVNVATAHALDWFFIVLTSVLTLAAPIIVPLVVEKQRWLLTFASFAASLNLLLLTCNWYASGDWFAVASVAVMLGLSVAFAPVILHTLGTKGILSRSKGLISMMLDTLLLYALILVCGQYATSGDYLRVALLITSICAGFAWLLFLVIRYLPTNGLVKAGISVLAGGVFLSLVNDIILWVLEGSFKISFLSTNLLARNNDALNANAYLLMFVTGCVVGGILLIVGLQKHKRVALVNK